jgi:WD40 repeat protein
VWDVRELKRIVRLDFPPVRGIVALTFSADGTKLVACGSDDRHTLFVWDWRKNKLLAEVTGQNGTPPQVYGLVWNPNGLDQFVSFGINHVKTWGADGRGSYKSTTGAFGQAGTHVVLSVALLRSGIIVSGMPEGQLCIWKGNKCVRVVRAHGKGHQTMRPDGFLTYGGVCSLCLRDDGKVLFSAGADGNVIAWDVSGGDITDAKQILGTVLLKSGPESPASLPQIRTLDCYKDSNTFIAGTNRCDYVVCILTTSYYDKEAHKFQISDLKSQILSSCGITRNR